MRLLLVDDDDRAAASLARALRRRGYAVDVAPDGDAALVRARSIDYDALIVDLTAAPHRGPDVCGDIRASGNLVPILLVTAADSVGARIDGLDGGADACLIRPLDFEELLARLHAVARRDRRPAPTERIVIGALAVDTRGRRATVGDREVTLTSKEYAVLEYLARHAGDVISRGEIAERVWDEPYDPSSNIVEVYIQRIRRKLTEAGAGTAIRTRRGKGYQFVT